MATRALYRLILALFPRDFRDRNGDAMEALFMQLLRERGHWRGRLFVWSGALLDALRHAPLEWAARFRPRRLHHLRDRVASDLLQDARYALRSLARSPGPSAVALLTLALGIGATAVAVNVTRTVVLSPLPYPEPHRLVVLGESPLEVTRFGQTSMPNFLDWRESPIFAQTAAYFGWMRTRTGAELPERIRGGSVTPSYFDVLGAELALGRGFSPEEGVEGQDRVLVLSYGFWHRAFGGEPNVIGREMRLDGESYVIVGVLDRGASDDLDAHWGLGARAAPSQRDVWQPMAAAPRDFWRRNVRFLRVIGRLEDGVTLDEARAAVKTMGERLQAAYPEANADRRVVVAPLRDALVGDTRMPLLSIAGTVLLVLSIGCANVTHLLLARITARESELAVRRALGAGRGRLMRQSLSESVLLGLGAGGLGLVLAWGLEALVLRFGPTDIPRLHQVRADESLAVAVLITSAIAALLFGLVPALRAGATASRRAIALRTRTSRALRWLIAWEAALALSIVSASGLFVWSYAKLSAVDPGYDADNVLSLRLVPPRDRFPRPADRERFEAHVLERIEALPGVTAAAASTMSTMSRGSLPADIVVRSDDRSAGSGPPRGSVWPVSSSYFAVLGIDVASGRVFSVDDRSDGRPVAVVSRSTARELFEGDPIGREVALRSHLQEGDPVRTIVGVVNDVHFFGLDRAPPLQIFVPRSQWRSRTIILNVRVASDPIALVPAVRQAVAEVDETVPVDRVTTLESDLSQSMARPRFYMLLLGVLALVALVLAAGGIYGVLSYSLSRRSHEIGIRMSLGARSKDVLWLVLREAMAPTCIGLGAGLLASIAQQRVLSSQLFGVEALELVPGSVGILVVAAAAVVSCAGPARRAVKIDPVRSVRAE